MYRNPAKIKELAAKIESMRQEYINVVEELRQEKMLVPVGYELIGAGDIVKDGALAFEPYHNVWYKTGNSVGEVLNDQGYVTGITHRGYKYANPL